MHNSGKKKYIDAVIWILRYIMEKES